MGFWHCYMGIYGGGGTAPVAASQHYAFRAYTVGIYITMRNVTNAYIGERGKS